MLLSGEISTGSLEKVVHCFCSVGLVLNISLLVGIVISMDPAGCYINPNENIQRKSPLSFSSGK